MRGRFASRVCGSSDLYAGSGKGPESSVNFVTCHDGFTLNDLVSYSRKHNEANGEGDRDGASENFSANYGVEGESADPAIEVVRERQIKNFLLTLAISRGVPMLQAGDEFRRTQRGNNNAYCQDNETSWVDWALGKRHREIAHFVRQVFVFRRTHAVLRREAFYSDQDIQWFDPTGQSPDWLDPTHRRLACLVHGQEGPDLYLMFNADAEPASFILPQLAGPGRWRLAIDTAQPSRKDFDAAEGDGGVINGGLYAVGSRASAILVAAFPEP
jgi:glycogen operon protein